MRLLLLIPWADPMVHIAVTLQSFKKKVDIPRFLFRKPGKKCQNQWLMAILCRFQVITAAVIHRYILFTWSSMQSLFTILLGEISCLTSSTDIGLL